MVRTKADRARRREEHEMQLLIIEQGVNVSGMQAIGEVMKKTICREQTQSQNINPLLN